MSYDKKKLKEAQKQTKKFIEFVDAVRNEDTQLVEELEESNENLRMLWKWLLEKDDLKDRPFSFKYSTDYFKEQFLEFCSKLKVKTSKDKESKPYL